MELMPARFIVQDSDAHFLSRTQMVSECEAESAYSAREVNGFRVMSRTHLFDDVRHGGPKVGAFQRRHEHIEANKADSLSALNTATAPSCEGRHWGKRRVEVAAAGTSSALCSPAQVSAMKDLLRALAKLSADAARRPRTRAWHSLAPRSRSACIPGVLLC